MNQELLIKLEQILLDREQLFQGKVISTQPIQVIITKNNQIVNCIALNNISIHSNVVVFKDLDTKNYYCFNQENISISSNSLNIYRNENRRKSKEVPKNVNVFYFLLDVSNSIEMEAIYKVKDILEGNIETPLKIKRNDLISISSFSDNTYEYSKHINKLNKKSKVIEILNNIINAYVNLEDKNDRYDSNSFGYADFNISLNDPLKDEKLQAYSTFWVNEGTDLPENAIDAIADVIANDKIKKAKKKYIYVITDNDSYSRNTIDLNQLKEELTKFKLIIDFIEPVNEQSEHIVVSGAEANPYCSSSSDLWILINNVFFANYEPPKDITITKELSCTVYWDNSSYLLADINSNYTIEIGTEVDYRIEWDSGTRHHDIINPNNYSYEIFECVLGFIYVDILSDGASFPITYNLFPNQPRINPTIISYRWEYQDVALFGRREWRLFLTYSRSTNSCYNYVTEEIFVFLGSLGYLTGENEPIIVGNETFEQSYSFGYRIKVTDDGTDYYYIITNVNSVNILSDSSNEIIIEGNRFPILDVNSAYKDCINTSKLKVENQVVKTLETNDEVKVICQPQLVPTEPVPSYKYVDSLPESDDIIYFDYP